MHPTTYTPVAIALALSACATVGPGATLPTNAPVGPTARVEIQAPPSRFRTLGEDAPVHHWVANDIVKYAVTLRPRLETDPPTFGDAVADPVNVTVKGDQAKTTAVFANLAQGRYYRAYVTALGNVKGQLKGALVPLNAEAAGDYTDFDFTASQDVVASLSHSVTVHFDGMGFNGTGGVTFGRPEDGIYVNPSAPPTITAR
ncbi:MAG: hypothetical protein JWM80_4762 [Cyanobacteria bacterium RYN_339]|nr:hypothetical protein [Cyanobacteria bacterium RYN_339]